MTGRVWQQSLEVPKRAGWAASSFLPPLTERPANRSSSALDAQPNKPLVRRNEKRFGQEVEPWTIAREMRKVATGLALLRATSSWLPILLDWSRLKRQPYEIALRDGTKIGLRPGTGDYYAFLESFVLKVYNRALDRLRPGDTVVDIGAHVGCFAIAARRRVGAHGYVIAVEPAQDCLLALQDNMERNGFRNVEIVPAAVAASLGQRHLIVSNNSLFSSLYDEIDGRRTGRKCQVVDTITLSDLFDKFKITRCDLLKLDCEGAEHDIADSMTLELGAHIRAVIAEAHAVGGKSLETFVHRMQALGFTDHQRDAYCYFTSTRSPSMRIGEADRWSGRRPR